MIDGVTVKNSEKKEMLGSVLDETETDIIDSTSAKTVIKFKIIEIINKFL